MSPNVTSVQLHYVSSSSLQGTRSLLPQNLYSKKSEKRQENEERGAKMNINNPRVWRRIFCDYICVRDIETIIYSINNSWVNYLIIYWDIHWVNYLLKVVIWLSLRYFWFISVYFAQTEYCTPWANLMFISVYICLNIIGEESDIARQIALSTTDN